MKKTQRILGSFMIHSFMVDELELSGTRLLIYAIIYSFTVGREGLYYGTQDYLSEMGGMSLSSVKRVLSYLTEKGYIEKCTVGRKEGYRATETRKRYAVDNEDMPSNDAEEELPPYDILMERGIDVCELIAPPTVKPKYVFHSIGKMGIVNMTAEQYQILLGLVDEDKLVAYISRIESMVMDSGFKIYNSYRTIRKWIAEDAAG